MRFVVSFKTKSKSNKKKYFSGAYLLLLIPLSNPYDPYVSPNKSHSIGSLHSIFVYLLKLSTKRERERDTKNKLN
jgi:hypothetical protein